MKAKKVLVWLCAAAMLVSAAGCGSSAASTGSDAAGGQGVQEAEGTAKEDLPLAKYPEEVTVHLGGGMNPNAKIPEGMTYEDNTFLDMLKEDLNINVVYDWVASSSDYDEKMNLCIGSNTIPELMNVNAEQYRALLKYDLIQPIGSYYEDYASDKLKSYVESGGEALQKVICNEDGEMMAIPAPNITAGGVNEMWIRQDWLDNLGLEAPRTWDEMVAVAEAFVKEDPDGNGKKDTAGLAERAFGAVFGAYGLRCVTGGKPGFKVEEMQLGEDNVPFFPYIHPDAKKALAKLHDWYEKGIVDKEFITGENHGGYTWLSHSFMNGKIGLTSAQPYHYLNASTDTSDENNWGVCMKELKGLNPDADIVIGPAPVGPDGKSGTEGWNLTGRLTCLTTKAVSDPRKVDAFLAMLDAYYADMDYARLVNYGLEGKHFEMTDNGPVRIMEGTELRKEGVLQVDFGSTVTFAENITPQKTKFGHEVTGNGYYRFNAPPVEEFANVIATLDTLTEQAYFDMITGAKPIDYFDTFVEEFKKAGGEAAEKAVQEAYAENLAALGK